LPQQGVAGEARIYEPARLAAHFEVEPEEVVVAASSRLLNANLNPPLWK
jgi:hypothetical protein